MANGLSEAEQLLAAGYVLGDLDSEELHQFEQQLANNPAMHQEVEALRASLRLVPLALPETAPPIALKQKTLATHAAETGTAVRTTHPPVRSRSIPWAKMVAAIASLGALILGLDNLRLRQSLNMATQNEGKAEAVATLLQQPNTRLVAIKGHGNNAEGTLMFTPGKWQEVVVSLGNLPPLPPEQVYRMWLTLQNGQILPCGEFTTNAQGAVFIKINPTQTPPKGMKAIGVFVTVDAAHAPMAPQGQPIMSGNI